MLKLGTLLVLAATSVVTPALAEAAPPLGVYECMGQDGLTPTLMLGLLDASTYSNYDGKTGHYSYDPHARVLTITDGPFKGFRYLRGDNPVAVTGADSLRMFDDKGQLTAFNCPLNHAKDAHKHPW